MIIECPVKHCTIISASGPLFIFPNGRNVSSQYFNAVFKSTILLTRGSCQDYSANSFRIGAATYCLRKGYSRDAILKMGRCVLMRSSSIFEIILLEYNFLFCPFVIGGVLLVGNYCLAH